MINLTNSELDISKAAYDAEADASLGYGMTINLQFMNSTKARLAKRASVLFLATAFFIVPGRQGRGQDVQHLSITQAGGMPGLPVMTGIQPGSNGVSLTWDGPSGYYQVFQKAGLAGSKWEPLGKATNLVRQATISPLQGNTFFRVSGPTNAYAGWSACSECHENIYATVVNTPHASAFETLDAQQRTNRALLADSTVGYGLTTGFQSQTATPQLEGVQCENCHGPAANHAASDMDPTVRPRVELAATVCGGCHTGPEHPTFEEWNTSAHAKVVAGVDLNSTNLIDSCGRCHSGSVRYSLLSGQEPRPGDADVGIVCATCHDPHQTNGNPAQVRYPLASTNDYYITAAGLFTNQINPAINLCAQCHNHRGASWTNSAAPPHHSPQYNILLGTAGELESGLPHYEPASHALLITNQCVGCHMQTSPYQGQAQPAVTGHTFTVGSYNLCLTCHPYHPERLVQFVQGIVSNQINQVAQDLDLWASNRAPASLWAKYKERAWEYTMPGQLSSGGPGPDASEQSLISTNIQKARFNLYLILNDGSYGVHNSPYSVSLLNQASQWIQAELDD
jgi:hypothetical protein